MKTRYKIVGMYSFCHACATPWTFAELASRRNLSISCDDRVSICLSVLSLNFFKTV